MMTPHEINKSHQFIRGWYHDAPILDKLVDHHTTSKHKYEGSTIRGVNKRQKDSTDLLLVDLDLRKEYDDYLKLSVDAYTNEYPFCNAGAGWNNSLQPSVIQYYAPGGAYFAWHAEKMGPQIPYVARHLVYMTYLNDVSDEGETEFYHQKLKVKPEKGLTLMWPAEWTFTHRGVPSPTQGKYIITGWFYYAS